MVKPEDSKADARPLFFLADHVHKPEQGEFLVNELNFTPQADKLTHPSRPVFPRFLYQSFSRENALAMTQDYLFVKKEVILLAFSHNLIVVIQPRVKPSLTPCNPVLSPPRSI